MPAKGGAAGAGRRRARARRGGIAIDDIGLRRPTLDDVFLSLTGHAAEVEPEVDAAEAARENDGRRGMSATTVGPPAPGRVGGVRSGRRDGLVVCLAATSSAIPRIPELAIFAILQSIMFVLLFAFVFGGAIPLPGYADPNAYREYLMPGIFAQTIAFAAATTAVGMCRRHQQGHHRPLPLAADGALGGADRADARPTSSTTPASWSC